MKEIKKALEALKGTLIEEDLLSIAAFYDALDKDLERFKEKAGFSCPDGCGKCCSIFVPDITRLESICIAAFIAFSENKEELIQMLENAKGRKTGACPLYLFQTIPYLYIAFLWLSDQRARLKTVFGASSAARLMAFC